MKSFFLALTIGCNFYAQEAPARNSGFFDKLSKADTLPGWFRFSKNTHRIGAFPAFGLIGNKAIGYGGQFTYDYFPVKRLSFGLSTVFNQWNFKNFNSYNDIAFFFRTTYCFFGNNKGFLFPFAQIVNRQVFGISNKSPLENLPTVEGNGEKFSRNTNYAGFGIGGGLYIFNNMTFHLSYSLNKTISNSKFSSRIDIFDFCFSYYFRKNQLPHSKKSIKDWFKSDRPKRTHAERREQEKKAKAGY